MTDYQKVLNKAKIKYINAVRGYDYQKELLKTELNLDETIFITKRRDIFKAEFTVLEDVFGSALFDESIEVPKTPKKSFYPPRVQEIADEIDIKMQQLRDLEDKIARRQQNEKIN